MMLVLKLLKRLGYGGRVGLVWGMIGDVGEDWEYMNEGGGRGFMF